MSCKLMIVVTTISISGFSIASSAWADQYRGAVDGRYFSGVNNSEKTTCARYGVVGEMNRSGYGFGGGVTEPRYHGGPKSPY
jgi:hypothetical protein